MNKSQLVRTPLLSPIYGYQMIFAVLDV